MSKYANIKYFLILFSIFEFFLCSNTLMEIKINETKLGALQADEYDFYKLTLPENTDPNSQLMFELEPNELLDSLNNIVSDPNLYISIDEIHPTSFKNTWSSNRFGDETISISGAKIFPFQYFHIGVHCNNVCNYKLEVTLVNKISLRENKVNSFNLEKNSIMKFTFNTKAEFRELSLSVVGSFLNSFKVYLAKKDPSSANTLPSEPMLFNGYKFFIKNDKENPNSNIQYELVVDNRDRKQDLNIWLKYDNDYTKIKEAEIIYDAVTENRASCYFYSIGQIEDYKDKDIILSTTLFNGVGFLYIAGFGPTDPRFIDKSYKSKKTSYNIIQNRVIHISKNDFKDYGNYEKNEDTLLNFCFFAEKNTSLAVQLHLFENIGNIQKLNYIYPGLKKEDILPQRSLTRYNMEYFDVENDLYVYLNKKRGNSKLYLYMMASERNNDILNYDNFQPLKKADRVFEAQENFQGYYIYLPKEINKCVVSKITLQKTCYLNAIVECDPMEDCVYELFFDHANTTKSMEPNQIYTNVIAEHEKDKYTITIKDPSVKNIAIVLTPITGKTVLKLDSFYREQELYQVGTEVKNNNFMPGVIKFSHNILKTDNLIGNFELLVEGLSYASYSIYYYSFSDEENEEYLDHDKVSMRLEKGNIIKDIFMDNHRFKIYVYDSSNNGKNKTNLYISLIETDWANSELYVFKDLNDFSYIDGKISGYLWKGEYKDKIYIDKNDKKYIENDILYIMVYKKTKTDSDEYTTFYLGITDEETPFLLNEGIEFKYQFDTKHQTQNFSYYYIDNGEDLQISFSLYSGHIFVLITIDQITYTASNIVDDSTLFLIRSFKINQICQKKQKCPIHITVSNDKEYLYYSSFLIAVKSTKNLPITLKQGVVNKRTILSGEKQFFIADLKPDKNFGARISAVFTKGQGEIYARKLLKSELYNLENFPDETNYEYMASYQLNKRDFYIIDIPYDDLADYDPCKILITVKGVFPGYFASTSIEYSLSISNNLNELVTDKNYRLFISQGEITHYHFKLEHNTKRLYISMSNKDQDANMYLNYEKYASNLKEYNWENLGSYNEYLDISSEDPYFTERQIDDIGGDYYLAIQGLNDCFFNLYISTQDVKMLNVDQRNPGSCTCESENDFCYFRYENLNDPSIREIKEQDLIFYTEYTYGSGNIFAKLYPNGNLQEIMNSLPSLTNNDFRAESSNDFLKVKLEQQNHKYTFSSVLVIGVQCREKSLFDLSAAILDKWADVQRNKQKFIFLDLNQDNIFYLSKDSGKENIFVYYIYQEVEFNFQIKSLLGKAQVHVYTNNSLVYNKFLERDDQTLSVNTYHHVSDFVIDSSNEKNKNYYGTVPKEYGKSNYLLINIKPEENSLININIHYDIEVVNIPLNKEVFGVIKAYDYFGYFDLLKDTEEFVITVTSLEKTKLNVYIKKNIIKYGENSQIDEQTKYSKPSELNYDIKGETNSLTSAISLRIKNIPSNLRKDSIVRVLVNIESSSYSYQSKVKIIVTPVIKNMNRIHPLQRTYYFSGMNKYLGYKTLFTMKNVNKEDDIMIIELSICKGNFFYILTDTPPLNTDIYSELKKKEIKSSLYSSNGKKIITVKNIKAQDYYLMLYSDRSEKLLDKNKNSKKDQELKSDIDLLFFYYTTNSKKYNYLVTKDYFNYESDDDFYSIKFILPELKNRDTLGRENYNDYMNYTFIVSEKKMDYKYMESTCYLTKLAQKSVTNNKYDYLKTNYDKNKNILKVEGFKGGKTYFINILAKNEYTGEAITYKPVMIETSLTMRRIKLITIILLSIIFIAFICIAFTIYRRYRVQTAKITSFDINRGPEDSLKRKIGNLNLNVIKNKYNTLNEDSKGFE